MSNSIDPTMFPATPLSPSGTSTSSTNLLQQSTGLSAIGGYGSVSTEDRNSWFAAMAKAWGQVLDKQAEVVTQLSDQISNGGNDMPSQATQLTAETERLSFLSTNASTATNSIGQALDTLGRKQ